MWTLDDYLNWMIGFNGGLSFAYGAYLSFFALLCKFCPDVPMPTCTPVILAAEGFLLYNLLGCILGKVAYAKYQEAFAEIFCFYNERVEEYTLPPHKAIDVAHTELRSEIRQNGPVDDVEAE